MTTYAELLKQFTDNQYQSVTITPDWAQGRAVFGGLVAALLFKACKHAVADNERKIRNAQITFVGPVIAGEELSFKTEILRSGGSATSIECKAIQNGQVQSTMIASFGKTRDSVHIIAPDVASPQYPPVADCKRLAYVKGTTPEFIRHFNMSWAEGGFPFSNTPDKTMGGWCQFNDQDLKAEEAEILTLIDSWPPIAIQMLDKLAPVSTLNWTVQFVQDMPELSTTESYQYRVTALQGCDGYSNTLAHLWSEEGTLLAISTQTVAVFA